MMFSMYTLLILLLTSIVFHDIESAIRHKSGSKFTLNPLT